MPFEAIFIAGPRGVEEFEYSMNQSFKVIGSLTILSESVTIRSTLSK
jgi:hypothetical protein